MKEQRAEEIQCIDYFLGQEIASGRVEQRGYAQRVTRAVLAHGHVVSKQQVYSRKNQVCVEGKILKPASFFAGRPTTRIGKDQNYHHLFGLWDQWVPRDQRYYIGLPANQLDFIASQIETNQHWCPMVACELDPKTYQHMDQLRSFIFKNRNMRFYIGLRQQNIFDVMQDSVTRPGGEKFNFFDLDLMIKLPDDQELYDWAQAIYRSANTKTPVILHVSAYAARACTELEHRRCVKVLCDALEHVGFTTLGQPTHHIYQDSVMPMGCLRVVLKKTRRAR